MRWAIKLFALLFIGWTISIILSDDAHAQGKKDPTVTQVNTATPVLFIIYEGEDGDGAVEIQIHDRKHQFVSMEYDRLSDQAKGNDPKNPLLKFIQMPEIDPLAFRQVESLEEAKLPVDGVTVIAFRLNKLKETHRIVYK